MNWKQPVFIIKKQLIEILADSLIDKEILHCFTRNYYDSRQWRKPRDNLSLTVNTGTCGCALIDCRDSCVNIQSDTPVFPPAPPRPAISLKISPRSYIGVIYSYPTNISPPSASKCIQIGNWRAEEYPDSKGREKTRLPPKGCTRNSTRPRSRWTWKPGLNFKIYWLLYNSISKFINYFTIQFQIRSTLIDRTANSCGQLNRFVIANAIVFVIGHSCRKRSELGPDVSWSRRDTSPRRGLFGERNYMRLACLRQRAIAVTRKLYGSRKGRVEKDSATQPALAKP